MKVYQLKCLNEGLDETVAHVYKVYSSLEEAEKALAYVKSLPEDPVTETKYYIDSVEVLESFVPWFTDEQVAQMQKELADYEEYLRTEVFREY